MNTNVARVTALANGAIMVGAVVGIWATLASFQHLMDRDNLPTW